MAMKSILSGPTLNAVAPADDPASNLRLLVVELAGASLNRIRTFRPGPRRRERPICSPCMTSSYRLYSQN